MFYAITNLRAYKLTNFFKRSYFEFCVMVKKAFVQTTIRLVNQHTYRMLGKSDKQCGSNIISSSLMPS